MPTQLYLAWYNGSITDVGQYPADKSVLHPPFPALIGAHWVAGTPTTEQEATLYENN